MAEQYITAKQLAQQLNLSEQDLMGYCQQANIGVTDLEEQISSEQQQKLRSFLEEQGVMSPKQESQDQQAGRPRKITLKRKTKSQLKAKGSQGDRKTVDVKVVKKRTYVPRPSEDNEQEDQQEEVPQEQSSPEVSTETSDAATKQSQDEAAVASQEESQTQAESSEAESGSEEKAEESKQKSERSESDASKADQEQTPADKKRNQKLSKSKASDNEEAKEGKKKKKLKPSSESEKRNKKVDLRKIDMEEEGGIDAPKRGRKGAGKAKSKQQFEKPDKPVVKEVKVPSHIAVSELAQRMAVKAADVIKKLMELGIMASKNQTLDQETAFLVVEEMGHKPVFEQEKTVEDNILEEAEVDAEQHPRAPMVTIMGHVDHGKTTLLDYIRRAKVAAKEAGGITQNIGAYHVNTDRGMVTFFDTPGHEAFTAMRARGAEVTDIVVLIVAADDGVMPQTVEAIQHAQAANVPIVVAVNKMDKPDADPERIKTELASYDVLPEEWGGSCIYVPISAKAGQGIDELLEAILLQAEMLELKARYEGPAKGIVVESRLEKGRGPVATVIVREGTLRKGDVVLAGNQYGRVRAMLDEAGQQLKEAGPALPVEILGLSDVPEAGDDLVVSANERQAREAAIYRDSKRREEKLAKQEAAKLENLFEQMEAGATYTLKIVLKADVHGSLQALDESLSKLSTDEVKVEIIGKGVGGITTSDVNLALASQAVIIGFNVRADNVAREAIKREGVDVHYHSVIYDAIDEVKRAIKGMVAPEYKQEIIGLAEVRDVFRSSKLGSIAGCMVMEGAIKRNKPIRVLRDNVVIYEGELESLRRYKDDVNEVKKGIECGIGVKNYNDIKVGDQIEVFDKVKNEAV